MHSNDESGRPRKKKILCIRDAEKLRAPWLIGCRMMIFLSCMHPVIFANSSAFTGTSLRHVCVEFFQEMWPAPVAELEQKFRWDVWQTQLFNDNIRTHINR